MIILDANVLIGFLDASDSHHAAAVALLDEHAPTGFAASVLTVAEALVHPTVAGIQDRAASALDAAGVLVLALEPSDARTLARVRAEHRVRMPDAVALHNAITTSSTLATFDTALASAARSAGVTVLGVTP